MNDLDDIRRAIDDDVYAHGKVLTPNDRVRRAISRRRIFNRVAVAGTSALVAAAAVVAVTLIRPTGNQGTIGTPTATAIDATASPTPTGGPATDTSSPTAVETSPPPTGAALPTAGVGGLLAAVQWHGSYGALVAVDPATGAVNHTYTTGITDPGQDILRYGNDVYFVSKTDIHGCSTEWTGIDLVTGNPTAVPRALTERPIQSAAMTTDGRIVTA
ncbi:MAG: hypothetical protein QOC60_295, partial [Frankiaceae bacterium]|nr:hypothetical protein [Frankiaceae bacterium]